MNEPRRTDESSAREIQAQIASLREVVEERSKRHDIQIQGQNEAVATAFAAQKEAINTALAAQKEAVTTAFAAQEKAVANAFAAQKELFNVVIKASETAVEKAENAQQNHNRITNEFRAALDDANKANISRFEAEQRFGQLRELIEASKAERIGGLDRLGRELVSLRETLTKEIGEVRLAHRETTKEASGRDKGLSVAWTVGLAIIGAIGIVAGIAGTFFAIFSRNPS